MKKALILIPLFFLVLGFGNRSEYQDDLNELREVYKIDANNIPYTYKDSVMTGTMPALVEWGAKMYSDTRLSAFGASSCEASCHVKGNHLAPDDDLQVALGGYRDHNGTMKLSKYVPDNWITDNPKINSPQAENLVFRKRVLHDCITDASGQASERFGLFAHNLDWTNVVDDEEYKTYARIVFNANYIDVSMVTKALVTFQESAVTTTSTPFQAWANGKRMQPRFYEWLDYTNTNCLGCHGGKDLGGGGFVMSNPVYKEGTDISFLRSDSVAVRSLYNNDAFNKYGWVGDYSTLSGFLNKHYENEDMDFEKWEKKLIQKGLEKYLND